MILTANGKRFRFDRTKPPNTFWNHTFSKITIDGRDFRLVRKNESNVCYFLYGGAWQRLVPVFDYKEFYDQKDFEIEARIIRLAS